VVTRYPTWNTSPFFFCIPIVLWDPSKLFHDAAKLKWIQSIEGVYVGEFLHGDEPKYMR